MLRTIINKSQEMAQTHRENKAERRIWTNAGILAVHLMDSHEHTRQYNIGNSPKKMDDEEYIQRVGNATVTLCQVGSFGNDLYIYDHEASVKYTETVASIEPEFAKSLRIEGLRVVFHKIMDPAPEITLEELARQESSSQG
jgi:hypothetical protein